MIDGGKKCIKQRSITSMMSTRSSECIRSCVKTPEGVKEDAKGRRGGGVTGVKHAGGVLKEM